jgi:pyruvate formate lyase activating enzyme
MSGNVSVNRNPDAAELRVGGLARFSTCDWPGELVATIFCQGCGWDCPYCHNPHLRPMQSDAQLPWSSVMALLESRRGLLDAVVFSGGEPTIQEALLDAVKSIRSLGFRLGLHTAGIAPERFAPVLPLLDWVGFDVKAPFSRYPRITGVKESGNKALTSLRMLLESGVAYEVRTTLHPALLSVAERIELRDELISLGVRNYAVQLFRSEGADSNRLPPAATQLQATLPSGYGDGFDRFQIRGE